MRKKREAENWERKKTSRKCKAALLSNYTLTSFISSLFCCFLLLKPFSENQLSAHCGVNECTRWFGFNVMREIKSLLININECHFVSILVCEIFTAKKKLKWTEGILFLNIKHLALKKVSIPYFLLKISQLIDGQTLTLWNGWFLFLFESCSITYLDFNIIQSLNFFFCVNNWAVLDQLSCKTNV